MNFYKGLTAFFAAIIFAAIASAQTITVRFPHFAEKKYVFSLYRGTKVDTIQTGIIGKDGQVALVVPDDKKGYVGIGAWAAEGGELKFIVDKENFSIECVDPVPSENTIVYKGSVENDILKNYRLRQNILFQELSTVFQIRETSAADDSIRLTYEQQLPQLEKTFELYQKELAENKSYSAFYLRTINFLSGLGSRLYPADDTTALRTDLVRYIAEEVNVDYLYNSDLWNYLISLSFELFPDKTAFGEAMIQMLKRTTSPIVFEAFAHDLVTICEQFGWTAAEDLIVSYLLASGRILEPKGIVQKAFLMNKLKPGSKAPEIKGQKLSNTLLFFYESGCDHCLTEIANLKQHYAALQKKGIRVISISVDEDKTVFEYHSAGFPWPDKLCDFKGFDGEILRDYSVLGTPTFYLIDKEGNILDRQAQLHHIQTLNF
jgi:peroxiredoxin